ncbi:MAG: protein kinase, partial [Myxococcales bacterium]|nr:protein kinase [Myxococcales bacterium]
MQLGDTIGQGRFRLEHVLGSGTFGTVYHAEDLETGEAVALKVLHHLGADSLMRFKREFRALAALRHPHLVRLHELHEDEGTWFFSMELVRGQMLASALGTPGTESVNPRP